MGVNVCLIANRWNGWNSTESSGSCLGCDAKQSGIQIFFQSPKCFLYVHCNFSCSYVFYINSDILKTVTKGSSWPKCTHKQKHKEKKMFDCLKRTTTLCIGLQNCCVAIKCDAIAIGNVVVVLLCIFILTLLNINIWLVEKVRRSLHVIPFCAIFISNRKVWSIFMWNYKLGTTNKHPTLACSRGFGGFYYPQLRKRNAFGLGLVECFEEGHESLLIMPTSCLWPSTPEPTTPTGVCLRLEPPVARTWASCQDCWLNNNAPCSWLPAQGVALRIAAHLAASGHDFWNDRSSLTVMASVDQKLGASSHKT